MADTEVVEKKVSGGPAYSPFASVASPLAPEKSKRCAGFISVRSHRSNAGDPCKLDAQPDSNFCLNHDPSRAEQRKREMAVLTQARADRKRITDLAFLTGAYDSFDAILTTQYGLSEALLTGKITTAEASTVSGICAQATRTLDLRRQDKLTTALSIHISSDGKVKSATLKVKGDAEQMKRVVESVIKNTDSRRRMDGDAVAQATVPEGPPFVTGGEGGDATGGGPKLDRVGVGGNEDSEPIIILDDEIDGT